MGARLTTESDAERAGSGQALGARFEIRRRLGSGGMGAVYDAFDRERGGPVALKVMSQVDPGAILRFKNEFRALADIRHENLVQLHELLWSGEEWVLTMELIDGVDLLSWVRPDQDVHGENVTIAAPVAAPPRPVPAGDGDTADTITVETPPHAEVANIANRQQGKLDQARLRAALKQLAQGVHALHTHHRVHLDIKPSNILVDASGRVALCDFGLIKMLPPGSDTIAGEDGVVGTVTHMSPEQAGATSVSPASDWYAVGVVLYQALTGRLPFEGSKRDVLIRKQSVPAPSASVRNPSAPPDLVELCDRLLAQRAEDRPTGPQVLEALGGAQRPTPLSTRSQPFIAREAEVGVMRSAFERARRGHTVRVHVSGQAGVGKSALVRRFVTELRSETRALVLNGRCYEHESVPFKAFDSAIDALTDYLLGLSNEAIDAILPDNVAALARLFPVLRRVRSIAVPPRPALAGRDPKESRRRAFNALRELLINIARDRPLVIVIDDMQWGDADSGRLLRELMGPPDAPALLVLGTFRGDEASRSPMLSVLDKVNPASAPQIVNLELQALSREESAALAARLLGDGHLTENLSRAIARESRGNPFFVTELVRYVQGGKELADSTDTGMLLHDVLEHRINNLPREAQDLLCAVAVAGQPIDASIARRAANLRAYRETLANLQVEHLLRRLGDRELEAFHDCVRETVVTLLGRHGVRDWHRRLATAHESAGTDDSEVLLHHWRGAGDDERAAFHAQSAAHYASETLAFERAAQLYQLALSLHADAEQARGLRGKLADALANAGHGAEAAAQYEKAAEEGNAAERLELRRRAAEQWLYTGYFERGLQAIGSVLADVGFHLAPTPKRALTSLVARRAGARLRGTRYRRRDPSQVAPERLTQVDVLWSAATGLSMIDTIHGADFQTRHLRLALSTGEPRRVARSLAMESAYSATGGRRSRKRAEVLCDRARALAEEIADPYSIAFASLVRGVGAYLRGEWRAAYDSSMTAEQLFRDKCSGVSWELTNTSVYALSSLAYLGELAELARVMPTRMREAEDHGNLYMINWLRSGASNMLWLAADDPDEAQRQVDQASAQWTHPGFHVQHYFVLWARCQIAMYRGDGARAWQLLDEAWPALKRSLLLRVRYVQLQALHLRARCALAFAASGGPASSMIKRALKDARTIRSERMSWTEATSDSILAGIAFQRGDEELGSQHLDRAAALFRDADMGLFAAACRYQSATTSRDATETAAADAELRERLVVAPDAMSGCLVPAHRR